MRYERELKKKPINDQIEMWQKSDQMYGDYRPDFLRDEEIRKNILQDQHPEIAKAMLSTLPRIRIDGEHPITNQEEAELYDEYERLAVNYFKVKQ